MSATIDRPRRSRHETEPTPEPVATDTADESATAETVTAKAEGIAYTLPRTAKAGDVHTDNSALVYDLAKARQFVSMMASKARSRAKKFAVATTDAEREANKAFTLDDYLAAWPSYVPEIAVRTGEGAVETMADTATWNVWLEIIKEHNVAVNEGHRTGDYSDPAIIARAKDPASGKPIAVPSSTYTPPRLTRNADDAQKAAHEAALATFLENKATHIGKMQAMPRFADRIAAELVALQTKAEAKKTAAAVAAAPSVAIGSLLD